jgi:predicted TIM-barrel fold metal-dependent hydrolase
MALIDCDAHAVVGSVAALTPYLDAHWREVLATSQFSGPTDQPHPPNLETSLRPDLESIDGAAPGTTAATMRAQLLEPLEVELAILSCDYAVDSVRNPDAAAALASAVNDWIAEEWLDADPRLRAPIIVATNQPALAAREIARLGGHPGFVAVQLPIRSAVPYGNRIWSELFDAATAHGLVVELHFGGSPGLPPTAAGWPTTWLEDYVDMASAFQSQLTSLVVEGVFDRYESLRVALIESGFAWLPAFLWRFDKSWRGLRREIPWTRRPPSEYVHEHVRVALQPVDGPRRADELARVLDQLDAERLLMFASDYPHRHSDEGLDALPAALSASARARVLSENAREHYRLQERR